MSKDLDPGTKIQALVPKFLEVHGYFGLVESFRMHPSNYRKPNHSAVNHRKGAL